jgi:hypothetical protein
MPPFREEYTPKELVDMALAAREAGDNKSASRYIKDAFGKILPARKSIISSIIAAATSKEEKIDKAKIDELSTYIFSKMIIDVELLKEFIWAGANINAIGANDKTALREALDAKNFDAARSLLYAGADANYTPYYTTYYDSAKDPETIYKGVTDRKMRDTLIRCGAYIPGEREPNQSDKEWMTPGQLESYRNAKYNRGRAPSEQAGAVR